MRIHPLTRHLSRKTLTRYGFACGTLAVTALLAAAPGAPPSPGLEPDGAPDRRSDGPGVPPPIVWPAPPLGHGPFPLETAEDRNLRVVVVARDLEQPWSVAFLPNGDLLVTERPGRLRIV